MPPVWPAPAPDPPVEHGEDPETNLLPDLARLRTMTGDQRRVLFALVADWVGPAVELFRARVRAL